MTIALTLIASGLLAGTVNFFYTYLNLPVVKEEPDGSVKLLQDDERWSLPRLTYWLALTGYWITSVTGAFLTPLLSLILDLKGAPPDGGKWNCWYLLGYGIIIGFSTNRVLSGVITNLLTRINSANKKGSSFYGTKGRRSFHTASDIPDFTAEDNKTAGTTLAIPVGFDDIENLPGDPKHYARGIDISHHNNVIDWKAIKNAGVDFVYIKISEGVGTPDSKAQTHGLLAKQNGFKVGYYHFGRPDTRSGGTVEKDAKAEAAEVRAILSNLPKADLPLMLDLEDAPPWDSPLQPANYLLWVETFLEQFYDPTSPDQSPLIYSRKEYLDRKLPANHTLGSRYKLWISRYDKDYRKALPAQGWNNWALWQFTEKGRIGINSDLDLNIRSI